jgi:hypothetical protein
MDSLGAKIVEHSGGVIAGGLGVVLEFILRKVIKSKKPLSIAHGLAKIAHSLAALIKNIADGLDKLFPQNLK